MLNMKISLHKVLFLSVIVMIATLLFANHGDAIYAATKTPTNTKTPTSTKTLSPKALTATAQAATSIPPTPIPTYTQTPLPDYTLSPNDITTQLDRAHTVTQLITYDEGGTMTLTDGDGNKYTASFPPHSVLMDTKVTMTTLQSFAPQSRKSVPVI